LGCIDACSFNALIPVENDEGFIVPQHVEYLCQDCNKCVTICPVSSTNIEKKSCSPYPMASWSLDQKIRINSTSGGVFAELAKKCFEAGGYVAGAVMENMRVRHLVTDSLSDITRFQGSKYLQSDTKGVYSQIKSLLTTSHPVLFSGTPCQVAGLKHFLGKIKNTEMLITVEVVCHGVPSEKIMEKFLEYEKDITDILSFRDKRHGWKNSFGLTIKRQGTKAYIPIDKNYFTKIFLADNALRWSCYCCPFAGDSSHADLSLADFWRLKQWPEEHKAGVSTVIVRTEKGERYFWNCTRLKKEYVTWEDVAGGNPRLCSGKHLSMMRWHPLRINLKKNLQSMESRPFLHLYSGKTKVTPYTFWIKLANRIWAFSLQQHRHILLKKFLDQKERQRVDR
jgi:coenzyme F420-reducing hydrogenase beta subunit